MFLAGNIWPDDGDQEICIIAWSTCGRTATWQITSNGVLTISGDGLVTDDDVTYLVP